MRSAIAERMPYRLILCIQIARERWWQATAPLRTPAAAGHRRAAAAARVCKHTAENQAVRPPARRTVPLLGTTRHAAGSESARESDTHTHVL